MKAAAGSGLNTGFFTYIGPTHKQPHDEIDFEVLGKDPSKVQINQYVDGKSVGDAEAGRRSRRRRPGLQRLCLRLGEGSHPLVCQRQAGQRGDRPAKLPSHPSKIFSACGAATR